MMRRIPEARYTAPGVRAISICCCHSAVCARASALRFMLCDVLGWRLRMQHLCLAVPLRPSTAHCSVPASLFPIAILTTGLRLHPNQLRISKDCFGRYLKAMGRNNDVKRASWPYSGKMRPPSSSVVAVVYGAQYQSELSFAEAWKTCPGLRLLPTSANGQPAFAVYEFSRADKTLECPLHSCALRLKTMRFPGLLFS